MFFVQRVLCVQLLILLNISISAEQITIQEAKIREKCHTRD